MTLKLKYKFNYLLFDNYQKLQFFFAIQIIKISSLINSAHRVFHILIGIVFVVAAATHTAEQYGP